MTIQTTIQAALTARRSRREVRAALTSLTDRPVRVQCEEGVPVRIEWPLSPAWRSADAHADAEAAAVRLASWGDWEASAEPSNRRVVLRLLPDWPESVSVGPDTTSTPILGFRRSPGDFHPVSWDTRAHRNLTVTGWEKGKTVLARAVARQWPGDVMALGRTDEWDSRRYRVLTRLSDSIPALEGLVEDAPDQPFLVVVDGLDDHVVDDATEDQIERIHAVLRSLARGRGVHLVVIARREEAALPYHGLCLRTVRGAPRGRMTVTVHGEEIEILPPYVAAPGVEVAS